MAEWGIALSRWSNPFAPAFAPAGGAEARAATPSNARDGHRAEDRRASAPTSTPSRSSTPTFETSISRRACVAYRDAMAALAASYPGRHRGVDLLRAGDRRGRAVAARQDLRGPAEGRRDSREAHRDAAGSSRPRALHHPQLRRAAARRSRARGRAPLREDRARRRRTRSTCRRTRSRASATGRSRSTPTSPPADVAKRDGVDGEELHSMDYRTYAYLQTAQDAAARELLDALPEVDGAVRPERDRIGRRRTRPASSRSRRSRRATRSSAAPGPTPRRSSRRPSRYLVPGRADLLREGARRRAHSATRPTARGAIEALQRDHAIGCAQQEEPTGPSRPRSSGAQRRRGWRWPKDAAPKRSPRCAPPRRWKTPRRSRPSRPARWRRRASWSARCCCRLKRAGRGAEGIRSDAEEGAEPVPRAVRRRASRRCLPATARRRVSTTRRC